MCLLLEVGLPAGDEARIRLFGQGRFDSTRALGVVELFEEDRWGMLCDREPEDVSRTNAQILCSHLFVGHKVEGKTVTIPVTRCVCVCVQSSCARMYVCVCMYVYG